MVQKKHPMIKIRKICTMVFGGIIINSSDLHLTRDVYFYLLPVQQASRNPGMLNYKTPASFLFSYDLGHR